MSSTTRYGTCRQYLMNQLDVNTVPDRERKLVIFKELMRNVRKIAMRIYQKEKKIQYTYTHLHTPYNIYIYTL